MQKKFNFKLGADPEFTFVMQDRRIHCNHLLGKMLSGKPGFVRKSNDSDNAFMVGDAGEIGCDGHDSTGELRPRPVETPEGMVNNLRTIFEKSYEHLKLFDMMTLSTYASIGGHIHFEMNGTDEENKNSVNSIHKKLSSFALPIIMSENKISLRLRQKNGYGSLDDFRYDKKIQSDRKTHKATYEFRTPSAEWLITPKICEATFAYLGVVYNEIINNPENFKKFNNIILKNNDHARALMAFAVSDYSIITKAIFGEIKKAVRTFSMYNDYKQQCEYILNPGKVMKDKKAAEYNIVVGWGLRKKSDKVKLESLLDNKAINEKLKNIDMDGFCGLINIMINNDINIKDFADELNKTSIANNWQLKNSYYLFGLRKGVEHAIVCNSEGKLLAGEENVKTTLDNRAMEGLIARTIEKVRNSFPEAKVLDPSTGEIINNKKIFCIGLTYDTRIARDYGALIKMIYELENETFDAHPEVDLKQLVDDTGATTEAKLGDFYRLINNGERKFHVEVSAELSDSDGARIIREIEEEGSLT